MIEEYSELKNLVADTGIDLGRTKTEEQKLQILLNVYDLYANIEKGIDPYYQFTTKMLNQYREIKSEVAITEVF